MRVQRAQYRWHATKPFYALRFGVLAPKNYVGSAITARLYCTPKALWKLNWFLRDFGYDPELLARDEVEDKNLVGLSGVVKVSHTLVNGSSLLNLDGFAPASQWTEDGAGGSSSSKRSTCPRPSSARRAHRSLGHRDPPEPLSRVPCAQPMASP